MEQEKSRSYIRHILPLQNLCYLSHLIGVHSKGICPVKAAFIRGQMPFRPLLCRSDAGYARNEGNLAVIPETCSPRNLSFLPGYVFPWPRR